jgi:EAL domain-containing protein (putative c-di-GMP-specific phosphodiesterase class I)
VKAGSGGAGRVAPNPRLDPTKGPDRSRISSSDPFGLIALETDLHHAIDQRQFTVLYQPQVDERHRVLGAEALVRWRHPTRGLVSPAHFIPFAEQSGLIIPIGDWVIRAACERLRAWADQPSTRALTMAVNVSLRQFRQPDFVAGVRRVLEETGASPALLKLELTESMMVEDMAGATAKMHALKDLGATIAIDDFGTGYSSLSYLMRLPIDQLKVDGSFVANLPGNTRDAIITRTIISMATSLGLDVIAEGVESESQLQFLRTNGCHAFQGYLFAHPLPANDFESFLEAGPPPFIALAG